MMVEGWQARLTCEMGVGDWGNGHFDNWRSHCMNILEAATGCGWGHNDDGSGRF